MKDIYRNYLFTKGILVSNGEKEPKEAFETLYSLAHFFGVRITDGAVLAGRELIKYCQKMIGYNVPEPFYRHFPTSVRGLSSDQLLFDQAMHYITTYGLGNFSEPGHSVWEQALERDAFKEDVEQKPFVIITEKQAVSRLKEYSLSLMDSTRPLSDMQYDLVLSMTKEGILKPEKIASVNTAIRLLSDTREMYFTRFLRLSDVIKLVMELNYREYKSEDVKKLNLKNRDRRFVTSVIDALISRDDANFAECFEKRDLWKGLLHHLHYRPCDAFGEEFVNAIRGGKNISVYSSFEKAMEEGDIRKACDILRTEKGPGEVLRKLDYMVSRVRDPSDIDYILSSADTNNAILLIQLLASYRWNNPLLRRTFSFTRFEKSCVHQESFREMKRRRSALSEGQRQYLGDAIEKRLRESLRGRLGKVYVDDGMKDMGLPLSVTAVQEGYGVMTTSSRIHLPGGKKIRAFTYWEKVNDIDLSVMGLTDDGQQTEFSWRTMADRQSDVLLFSGDQTSGYKGGSEYFDIDPEGFRKMYPRVRYLVFCNNVYSGIFFSECVCTAGYMLRDLSDSGEVFEPKTVKSSFAINCESTFAYLFALDLEKNDFVWLNTARSGSDRVAGESSLAYLIKQINMTEIINVGSFFEMAASETVDSMEKADIIVSDGEIPPTAEGSIVVRSTDTEKILTVLNGGKLLK